MSRLILFVVGGPGFFVGCLLAVAGFLVVGFTKQGRWGRLSILLGALLVAASATPLPWLLQVVIGLTGFASLIYSGAARPPRRRAIVAAVAAVAWLVAAGVEFRWHLSPRLPNGDFDRLAVIGDSLSAGVEEGETTWPRRLPLAASQIDDRSRVGATATSAMKQANAVTGPCVVVVEIGGNDVLGSTTADEFEHDLDALLSEVVRPDREIVMLELPLPPTYERFGRIQRRLARRHGVHLVPRRVMLYVLTTGGATLDSIHLSPVGHETLAEAVWAVVGPAFANVAAEQE